MKQSNKTHYSLKEKRQRLLQDGFLDGHCRELAGILDCLDFAMLRRLAKAVRMFSQGKKTF